MPPPNPVESFLTTRLTTSSAGKLFIAVNLGGVDADCAGDDFCDTAFGVYVDDQPVAGSAVEISGVEGIGLQDDPLPSFVVLAPGVPAGEHAVTFARAARPPGSPTVDFSNVRLTTDDVPANNITAVAIAD